MSAGAFTTALYQTDAGAVAPIRVQPETLAFSIGSETNDAAVGPATTALFVKASKSNRAYGVGARKVVVRFTATLPTGYKSDQTYAIPCMQPTIFAAATPTATGTYLGQAIEVVSRRAENSR